MSGMGLNMGLGGSVFAGGFPTASVPSAAGASPQGPTTIGQKAFGIVSGDPGTPATSGLAILGGGGFALAALIFIWWSLPR